MTTVSPPSSRDSRVTLSRPSRHDLDVRATYRYIRLAVPLAVVMLTSGVLLYLLGSGHWLGSVSAYYYTPARASFVVALCLFGACLLVYRGNSDLEDVALNFAGLTTFVVALVPTPLDCENRESVLEASDPCTLGNVPTSAQVSDAVTNNLWAVIATGLFLLVTIVVLGQSAASTPRPVRVLTSTGLTAALAALAYGLVADRALLATWAHAVSAITLCVMLIAVIAMNGLWFRGFRVLERRLGLEPGPESRLKIWYSAIAWFMIGAGVVLGGLAAMGSFDHTIFWLEALIFGSFLGFWILQSTELWDAVDRTDKQAQEAENGPGAPTTDG